MVEEMKRDGRDHSCEEDGIEGRRGDEGMKGVRLERR